MKIEIGSDWKRNVKKGRLLITFFKVTFFNNHSFHEEKPTYTSTIWVFNFYINIFY